MKFKTAPLIILIAAFIFLLPQLISITFPQSRGVIIPGPHDTLWHVSLIRQFQKRPFSKSLPNFSDAQIQSYNYLADFLIGVFFKFAPTDTLFFYLSLYPALSFLVFFYLLYKLCRQLTPGKTNSIFTFLFCAFSSHTAHLIFPSASKNTVPFMISPLVTNQINPHAFLGLSCLLASLIFLTRLIQKKTLSNQIALGLSTGLAFGFKAYYFLPFLLSLIVFSVYQALRRQYRYLLPSLISLLIFLFLLNIFGSNGQTPFQFKPFWILTKMVENPERLNWSKRILLDQHYQQTHNYLRLGFSLLQKLLLYFWGNLSLKGFALIYFILQALKKKNSSLINFLLLTTIVSLTLPLFIIPSTDPYNAGQLGEISLLFTGLLLGKLLSNKKTLQISSFGILAFGLFHWVPQFKYFSALEIEAYQSLRNLPSQSLVADLTPQGQLLATTPGFSGQKTYLSDLKILQLTSVDYQSRLNFQNQILTGKANADQIREQGITHLLFTSPQFNSLSAKNQLQIIFQNSRFTICSL